MSRIVIIGAGIVGPAVAIGLRTLGWDVDLYEQAHELKPLGAGIMLSANALSALKAIGLYDAVVAEGQAISRLSILDQRGRTLQTTDHTHLTTRYGYLTALELHRAELHRILLSQLPAKNVHTGKPCVDCHQTQDRATVKFADGQSTEADLVLGCDGLHSTVRKAVFPNFRERFAGYSCWRGVARRRSPTMDPTHVTESWGRAKRFGIVPLKDGRVYWFACVSVAKPEDPALAKVDVLQLREIFSDFHAPVQDVLKDTPDEALIRNDIFDLEPMPVFAKGRIAVLGDAAHAPTPDLGQGAGQALEDAAVLAALLGKHPFGEALAQFNLMRVPRANKIVKKSRRFGMIAQWRNPFAVALRNLVVKSIPAGMTTRELDAILNVRFEHVERAI